MFKVIRGEASTGAPSVMFRRLVAIGACVCIPEAILGNFANNVAHKVRISPLGPGAVIRAGDFCHACCTSSDPVLGISPPSPNGFYHVSSVLSVHVHNACTCQESSGSSSIRINCEASSAVVALIIRHVMRREARSPTGGSCTSYGLGWQMDMQTCPASLATIAQGR